MKNVTRINKAVFPVAGLGTRFLPATKAIPKEMLPVVDRPLIQYAVEEAYEAGIRHMVFVTGRSKRAIEDHFDSSPELEMELEAGKKKELLDLVRSLAPADMSCSFVRQARALGLGHAVLCAAPIVGDEPFAVLLPDDLMTGLDGGPSVLAQMVQQFERTPTCLLAVQEVPREHVKRYGIVAGDPAGERLTRVKRMVEKPDPDSAPSRMGVAGRYVLTPAVFHMIRTNPRGAGGEIQLTDSMIRLQKEQDFFAVRFDGEIYDCGSKIGFLMANVAYALAREDLGPALKAELRRLL
jgi:UTP--glucose-1-phosphate uridylyltransferase